MTAHRAFALLAVCVMLSSVLGLTACGGSGGTYGSGGGSASGSAAAPSKLFGADSTDTVIGSLANPNPAAGPLTVDRVIGPTSPYFFNYAGFSTNIRSLALDTTRDYLYVGNGTLVLVFHGASMAHGDLFADAKFGPIGNTGSMFLDAANDRLYVGDDVNDVKVFSGASTASGTPTPRHITGMTTPIHGVAVDTTTKNILYVSNDNSSTHQISVFDNADTVTIAAPNRTIIPTVSAVNQPVGGISLDATHDVLYVAPGVTGNGIMVFSTASTANGPIAPAKTLAIPSAPGILSVLVDSSNDRLYAVGSNGHIYLIEAVSTLSSGTATAKDASLSNGGILTAVAVSP